jgi:drug/metabolite transporter (DMT)-like permease
MRPNFRDTTSEALLSQSSERGSATASRSKDSWAYLFAALGAMLYSMKAIFVKLAYLPGGGLAANDLDAITLMTLRMGFALPVYIAILYLSLRGQGGIPLKRIVQAAILGVMGYHLCTYLDFVGLKLITAQLERLILFTYPVFVVIFGAIFFGGKITRAGILSIILAYCGLGVVFIGGDIATGVNVPLGSALILAAAIMFALFQLIAKRMIDALGSKIFTCMAMIAAATSIILHFILQSVADGGLTEALDLPPRIYFLGATIAFFSTILPSFLINISIGRIGAQTVAVMGMLGPLATIVAAIIVLGEPFAFWDAVGTVVTLSGIGLYMWLNARETKHPVTVEPRSEIDRV